MLDCWIVSQVTINQERVVTLWLRQNSRTSNNIHFQGPQKNAEVDRQQTDK